MASEEMDTSAPAAEAATGEHPEDPGISKLSLGDNNKNKKKKKKKKKVGCTAQLEEFSGWPPWVPFRG
jgi:hypothetical protein